MIEGAVKVERGPERPDAGEDEVELVELLGAVHRDVGRDDQGLEQAAERLDVRNVRDGGDLLEAVLHDLRQRRDVLVELAEERSFNGRMMISSSMR